MKTELPKEFLNVLNSVKSKRPRTVIQHIIEHGYITSDELKDLYGYNHPPRAIRDVRELGIPIITCRISDSSGKNIAKYEFGNPKDYHPVQSKNKGRSVLGNKLKKDLIEKYGSKCFIYLETMDEKLLQIDHRVPYEIGGESSTNSLENFMLLSPSANRMKSWSCEHCKNWHEKKIEICKTCFWAHPEKYDHIACNKERIINLIYKENEIEEFNKILSIYPDNTQEQIKKLIKLNIERK